MEIKIVIAMMETGKRTTKEEKDTSSSSLLSFPDNAYVWLPTIPAVFAIQILLSSRCMSSRLSPSFSFPGFFFKIKREENQSQSILLFLVHSLATTIHCNNCNTLILDPLFYFLLILSIRIQMNCKHWLFQLIRIRTIQQSLLFKLYNRSSFCPLLLYSPSKFSLFILKEKWNTFLEWNLMGMKRILVHSKLINFQRMSQRKTEKVKRGNKRESLIKSEGEEGDVMGFWGLVNFCGSHEKKKS